MASRTSPSSCRSKWVPDFRGRVRGARRTTAPPPSRGRTGKVRHAAPFVRSSREWSRRRGARGLLETSLRLTNLPSAEYKVSITCVALCVTSVVKKSSPRCVPVRSCTKTHSTSISPSPDLYQWPLPVTTSTRRDWPPYQFTVSFFRFLVRCTTSCGLGNFCPFTRGRPFAPFLGRGGAAYNAASPSVP